MARLPTVNREQVPEKYRDAFDELTADSGGTLTSGPYSILINSPEAARRRGHLANYLRYESGIGNHFIELAILTAARAMDCPYIWNAHAPAARRAGLSDVLVDALRDRIPLPSLSDAEAAIINFGTEFFNHHRVSQATFEAALGQFGAQQLVELTTLMGHYAQTAFILNAFEVDLPEPLNETILPV